MGTLLEKMKILDRVDRTLHKMGESKTVIGLIGQGTPGVGPTV